MTLLGDTAAVSRRVAETSSRLEKIRELAAHLRALSPDEVPIAVGFLTGEPRQGKLGVSYAALRSAGATPAAQRASLALAETDAALAALAAAGGKGSAAARSQLLAALFGRATAEEQDFLARLIVGELRQGALKGI